MWEALQWNLLPATFDLVEHTERASNPKPCNPLRSAATAFPGSRASRLDVTLPRLFTSWSNFQLPCFA